MVLLYVQVYSTFLLASGFIMQLFLRLTKSSAKTQCAELDFCRNNSLYFSFVFQILRSSGSRAQVDYMP